MLRSAESFISSGFLISDFYINKITPTSPYTISYYITTEGSSRNTFAIGDRLGFYDALDAFAIGSNINVASSGSVTIGRGDDSAIGGPLVTITLRFQAKKRCELIK